MRLWLRIDCSDETFAELQRLSRSSSWNTASDAGGRYIVTGDAAKESQEQAIRNANPIWDKARDYVAGIAARLPSDRFLNLSNVRFDNGKWLPITGSGRVVAGPAVVSGEAHVVSMTITAIVQPLQRVSDGELIRAIEPAWLAVLAELQNDPEARFRYPPRMWEELIAASYKKAGFDEVILTPRSGDGGRDVIATRSSYVRVRVVDQVKAYKAGHLVTADEVRALAFTLHADHQAAVGHVTTTSDFAPRIADDPRIASFIPNRLRLVNGKELLERFSELRRLPRE